MNRRTTGGSTIAGRERSRGVALVEFALVFPLFALLLFGLIDIGRMVYVNNAVAEGAREGSRYASVAGRSQTSSGRAQVVTWTKDILTAVPDAGVTVVCERDQIVVSTCRSGDVVVVVVSSTIDPMTPVIGQLVGTLTVDARSRVEVQQ